MAGAAGELRFAVRKRSTRAAVSGADGGVTAAAAGILQSANNATANLTAPNPWMLTSIAAVFLGMAMFRNGLPNLPGTMLGVVLLRVLENGLNYTSINSYLQTVILGFAILLAVLPLAVSRLRTSR